MDKWFQEKEAAVMKCHVCGSMMKRIVTDLPFKVSEATIVIIKGLPVIQCFNCSEYLLDDTVLASVERLLENVDSVAELEVLRYAA